MGGAAIQSRAPGPRGCLPEHAAPCCGTGLPDAYRTGGGCIWILHYGYLQLPSCIPYRFPFDHARTYTHCSRWKIALGGPPVCICDPLTHRTTTTHCLPHTRRPRRCRAGRVSSLPPDKTKCSVEASIPRSLPAVICTLLSAPLLCLPIIPCVSSLDLPSGASRARA